MSHLHIIKLPLLPTDFGIFRTSSFIEMNLFIYYLFIIIYVKLAFVTESLVELFVILYQNS